MICFPPRLKLQGIYTLHKCFDSINPCQQYQYIYVTMKQAELYEIITINYRK